MLRWSPAPNIVSLTVLIGERKAWFRNILAPNRKRFDIEEETTRILTWIGSEKNVALIVSVNVTCIRGRRIEHVSDELHSKILGVTEGILQV